MDAPWYRLAFGPLYAKVYAHRDEREAEEAVRLVRRFLGEGPVLDLACGAGRHLAALARAGVPACGLDLSPDLLALAAARTPRPALVRGDARRLPFRSGRFSAVIVMFSSLGYFEEEGEDAAVVAEAARVLRRGGTLAIDLPGPDAARATAGAPSERDVEGLRVVEERRLADRGRRIEKDVRVIDRASGSELAVYTERLRLYEPPEIERMLSRASLAIIRLWGDYSGVEFGPGSPRLLVAAQRRGDDTRGREW